MVQFSGGLIYQDQSGALNESFSDVFGVLTEQYKHRQTASEANWLIGAEILGDDIQGEALRSMKAPGTAYEDDRLGKSTPSRSTWTTTTTPPATTAASTSIPGSPTRRST